jgi:serine/threonine protein kinase
VPALRPGEVFAGDFTIVRELAQGGMGTVYVAVQGSTGKQRALKLLRSEFTRDLKTRERFEQEARVASRIASEHIVEVLSAGIEPTTDTPWIAMELLEGSDLAVYQRERGVVVLSETRQILGQIGHALGAAHRAGVVHRDLKPENVFVAKTHQRDRNLVVKVLDFGIAKIVAEARAAQHDTAAVGTPRWMAPEQADSSGHISPATDVWAFGLLTFWLLTGQLFWRSANGQGGVMGMMREVLFDPLPLASVRAAELGVRSELPAGFDVWFARATMRDPTQRFADAAAAADALDAVLAGARFSSNAPPGATPAPTGSAPPAFGIEPYVDRSENRGSSAASAATGPTMVANAGAASWKLAAAIAAGLGVIGGLVIGAVYLFRDAPAPMPTRFSKVDAEAPSDLSGLWSIASSARPGNGPGYVGTVTLARIYDNYRLNWVLNRGAASYEGVGVVDGKTLNVAWANSAGYLLYLVKVDGQHAHLKMYGGDARIFGAEELEGPAGFSGTYTLRSSSQGYTGRVVVTPHPDCLTVTWTTNKGSWSGIGLKTHEGYIVAAMANGRVAGVVAYDIASLHKLTGRWAVSNDTRTGSETLVRK